MKKTVALIAVGMAGAWMLSGCTMGAAVAVTGDKYGGDPVARARAQVKLPPLRGPKRRVAVAEGTARMPSVVEFTRTYPLPSCARTSVIRKTPTPLRAPASDATGPGS